jgi:septal ring factor EnvC (AmiA/AmiB activator)
VTTGVLEATRRTDDEGAESSSEPKGHRRTWLIGLIGFAVFAAALGYLVGNQIQSNTQFDRTHGSLNLTRHDIAVVQADLTSVRHDLRALDHQVHQTTTALATDAAQLHQVQTALTQAQANVSNQGLDVTALKSCLGGVEQALNALSVGDEQTAVDALTAVSSSCQSALTSNG